MMLVMGFHELLHDRHGAAGVIHHPRAYEVTSAIGFLGARREAFTRLAIQARPRPGDRFLDVGCGTGYLTRVIAPVVGPKGQVTGVDPSAEMIEYARRRAPGNCDYQVAEGQALPFPDASFDAVTIGYGLRNFVDVDAGLREFRRVLRPGGRLVVLEFPPPPAGPVGRAFRLYFERVLPWVGGVVSGARGAYGYLPRSVKAFLPPEGLKDRMEGAGFRGVYYRLQTFGVSALHVGLAGDAPHGG